MNPTVTKIINFQFVFPSVLTIIIALARLFYFVSWPWFSIFLPLMISVPVGIILLVMYGLLAKLLYF